MELLLFFFLPEILSLFISIPFSKQLSDFNENYLFDNKILAHLSFGTPKVNLKFFLDFYGRFIYISDIKLGGLYSNNSKTYEFISDTRSQFNYNTKYFYFYFAKENFYINDRIEKFNFNYIYKSPNNGTLEYGILGFQFPHFKDEKNLKYQLKEKGLIDEYYYKIHFLNETSGEIIIGTNNSNVNNLEILTSIEYTYKDTNIKFEKIMYNDIEETNPKIKICYNLRGISVKESYFNIINETFFFPLIHKNKCKSEYINLTNNQFIYFVCDQDIDTKNFKELNFLNTKKNYTFTLNEKDLFKVYNKKKYCLIFFDLTEPSKWVLGQIFFEKYPMTINDESKMAIYYIVDDKKNNYLIIIIIAFISLIIIIIVLSFIIIKLLKKIPRRIRANELEHENYDYSTYNILKIN